jgi:hypothetical protein
VLITMDEDQYVDFLIRKTDDWNYYHVFNMQETFGDNKHKLIELLKIYKKQGRMKNCDNMKVDNCGRFPKESFGVTCEQSSLIEDEFKKAKIFIGCPKNCNFYKPMWKIHLKNFFKYFKATWNYLIKSGKWMTNWFASLHPMVQIFIVIAIVALFSLSNALKLIEILRNPNL